MTANLFCLALLAMAPAEDAERKPERNPFAPTLRLLSEKEEAELDHIINRFILFDIGRLKGAEGQKALADFKKLGPDAAPALIRGLNRAAKINHSCPALVIAKKLNTLLRSSKDIKLLEFTREEVGAGVGATRHKGILQDLRVMCMMRKNLLIRQGVAPLTSDGKKEAPYLTTDELAEAAKSDNGLRLKKVLIELGKRKNEKAVEGLGAAMDRDLSDITTFARNILIRNLTKNQSSETVVEKLKDPRSHVREAAIRAAFARKLPVGEQLIEMLNDKHDGVVTLAHRALVRISGTDYGPSMAATEKERQRAIEKWREWWKSRR